MIVLTASTPNQSALTAIQRESCLLNGIKPENHLSISIDPDYPRPYSWFKIRALVHHLPHHENILWMDADSMMLLDIGWDSIAKSEMVALARDMNGWNCGVMQWRRCPEAFDALWRIYDSFDKYRDHPWFEQAAFHTMAESFQARGGIYEWHKPTMNAQEWDLIPSSAILHLPGKDNEYRLRVMSERLTKMKS